MQSFLTRKLMWLTTYLVIILLEVSADESSLPSTDCIISGLFAVPVAEVVAAAVVEFKFVKCGSSGR